MSATVIYDTEAKRRYIDVVFAAKLDAFLELRDLLRPYPLGDPWRRRLVLRDAAEVPGEVRVHLPRAVVRRRAA